MNNIKQLRKGQGISVTELAQKLNMSQGNLSKIENGQLELKEELAQKIAEILNVSPLALTSEPTANGVVWLEVINPDVLSLPPLSRLPFPAHMLPENIQNQTLFAMPDDTMSPKIPAGSLVVIDKAERDTVQNGIYLLQIGQNIILRRLQNTFTSGLNLLSDNPVYPPQQIDISSINVIGKAILAVSSAAL